MNIHIITLGKLKEQYWRDAEAEYLKRLKPYAKIIIHELREESFDEKSNVEVIKKKEAEKITNEIEKYGNKGNNFVIVMDEHGKQYSSVELAGKINPVNSLRSHGASNGTIEQWNNITFVIGGPLGLDESVIKSANLVLSMSKFTFTHQIARVILLEQIYRGMMIANNRKYHY